MPNKNKSLILKFLSSAGDRGHSTGELRPLVNLSAITISRALKSLLAEGAIERFGFGRSVRYRMASGRQILTTVDLDQYFSKDIDARLGFTGFNHEIFSNLEQIKIWTQVEEDKLSALNREYRQQKKALSPTILAKEFERVTVEFSWKSSAIEGNTYSLLDTENLLREGVAAKGKTKHEATMILNHKKAMDFLWNNQQEFKTLTVAKIEMLHSILIEDLGINRNLRGTLVGITGTNYRPLDNEYQIREALVAACEIINTQKNTFAKAILGVILISYIQAFEDGNKRTSRMVGNALLIAHNAFPLSYRTVDEAEYKKATLLFYETNNISAFKKLFWEQAQFAVKTYFRSHL